MGFGVARTSGQAGCSQGSLRRECLRCYSRKPEVRAGHRVCLKGPDGAALPQCPEKASTGRTAANKTLSKSDHCVWGLLEARVDCCGCLPHAEPPTMWHSRHGSAAALFPLLAPELSDLLLAFPCLEF